MATWGHADITGDRHFMRLPACSLVKCIRFLLTVSAVGAPRAPPEMVHSDGAEMVEH